MGYNHTTLSMVEFAMNNSTHPGLTYSPFFLMYGHHPVTPIMLEVFRADKSACAQAWKYTASRSKAFEAAMQYLKMARDRYKSYADAGRVDTHFHVGDQVLLSTLNINKHQQCRKLYPKYIGPFTIIRMIGDVAYTLDLPPTVPIHPTFHVSLLKPYYPGRTPRPPPVPLEIEGHTEYEVESILLHREVTSKRHKSLQYYVKWLNCGPEDCTWEPETHLKNAPLKLQEYWEFQAHIHKHAHLKRLKPSSR